MHRTINALLVLIHVVFCCKDSKQSALVQKNVPVFSRTPAHTNEEKINNQKSETKLALQS